MRALSTSQDIPQTVFRELMAAIEHNLATRPRDLQRRIGPSEVGEECDRTLIAKLLQLPEPDEGPKWKAWVGTCMHAGLEEIVRTSAQLQQALRQPRFLLEKRVTVGRIGEQDLTGSLDAFDTVTGGVIDWKSKSKTQQSATKRKGIGQKYRVQFHCYGTGMVNLGYEVNWVGGIFLPRDGELADSYLLSEPYDPQITIDALARANRLLAMGRLLGPDLAMAQFPPCDGEYCRRCGNNTNGWRTRGPDSLAPRKVHTTLAEAIAAGTPLKGN